MVLREVDVILALLAAAAVQAPASAQIAAGERVARRACGECHAVAAGPSPLAGAPPFSQLYRRYPSGGLGQLLTEGMLPPDRPQEEGAAERHPRMPRVPLETDEIVHLKAYLTSLEPPPR